MPKQEWTEKYWEVTTANPGDELVMAAIEEALRFPESLDVVWLALSKAKALAD